MSKSWYSIKNTANELAVSIHDEIGVWGVSAKEFIADINAFRGADISLSIHSPGGSAFDGVAMYHALKNHSARVTTRIEGVAASAATLPFAAGDVRIIPEDGFLMVHNPFVMAMGDADELRDTADFLDKVKHSLVGIYQKSTGLDEAKLQAMLSEETWLSGGEAVEFGFATALSDAVKVAALAKNFAKKFGQVPQALQAAVSVDRVCLAEITTPQDFEKCLRDAGISKALATALTSKAKSIVQSESADEHAQASALLCALNEFKI